MEDNQRNDGLHPRHPGRGRCGLIELEGDKVEHGGFLIFLPSGRTKVISWSSPKPITPTIDAAKEYTAKVIEQLLAENSAQGQSDFDGTNWVSVVAAVQRILLDFNDKVTKAINTKMGRDLILPGSKGWVH